MLDPGRARLDHYSAFWEERFDPLDVLLQSGLTPSTKDKHVAASNEREIAFELARVFKAPLARVWNAWSDPAQFGRWWGPKGCAVDVARMEFRPGGVFHYQMMFEGGVGMWGRFMYREIAERERIVWLNSFANERGGIARAPFSELCPLEVENSVSFGEENGGTLVTLRAVPFGASEAEVGYFAELCSTGSLQQGYGGTFDQLGEHLNESA